MSRKCNIDPACRYAVYLYPVVGKDLARAFVGHILSHPHIIHALGFFR